MTNRALLEDSDDSDVSDASPKKMKDGSGAQAVHVGHEACAGCEEEDNEFICDVCK